MNQQEIYMEEDEQKDKYLTFTLGNEYYGLEIRHVTEIVRLQAITEVPELPNYIRGIINLRGKIIPVMDVRLRFKLPYQEYNDRTCIIVVSIGDTTIGLIIDRVLEVASIPDSEIVQPPEYAQVTNRYIQGIGNTNGEVKLLLDCNKLLSEHEVDQIANLY